MTLQALIQKMKDAGGPDRTLDAAIQRLIAGDTKKEHWFDCNGTWTTDAKAPEYTRLLDCALTIVPNDAFWRVGHDGEGADPGAFRADVLLPPLKCSAIADTPALALCIAALEARQKMKEAM